MSDDISDVLDSLAGARLLLFAVGMTMERRAVDEAGSRDHLGLVSHMSGRSLAEVATFVVESQNS